MKNFLILEKGPDEYGVFSSSEIKILTSSDINIARKVTIPKEYLDVDEDCIYMITGKEECELMSKTESKKVMLLSAIPLLRNIKSPRLIKPIPFDVKLKVE